MKMYNHVDDDDTKEMAAEVDAVKRRDDGRRPDGTEEYGA